MEIFASTEAKRLNLYHLASLFFHEKAEEFSIRGESDEKGVAVTLTRNDESECAFQPIDLTLHKEASRAENAAFGKAFANAAKAFTPYVPPYGLLFGVRPVKVPVFYRKNGFGIEETKKILREEFLVSEEKTELLIGLCETELSFEKTLTERDGMLYLSIPFCPSRCNYCSFISSSAPDHLAMIPEYVEQLKDEIRKTTELFQTGNRRLSAVYMGGGTPGILSAEQMESVLGTVRDSFDLSHLREFCVEMGRPETVTAEKLAVLKLHGAERISINPQTVSDVTLRRIGRKHSSDDFYRAMELAQKYDFASVNCDLIAGLEGESPEDFLGSLQKVLSLNPQEVTLHALCRKRSATGMELQDENKKWQDGMALAHKLCINHGLDPYYLYRQKNTTADLENTGFAKKGTLGIYNLAMMEDLCDIFSCGAGGIGKLLPKKSGDRIRRFPAFKYPFEYLAHPEERDKRLEEIRSYL